MTILVHTYKEVNPTKLQYIGTFASFEAANAYMEAHCIAKDWHNFARGDADFMPPKFITRED